MPEACNSRTEKSFIFFMLYEVNIGIFFFKNISYIFFRTIIYYYNFNIFISL